MPGLLTPNLKANRAKEHLESLDIAITEFRRYPEQNHRITSYEDLEKAEFVIKAEPVNEDSILPLGAIAGDFICNLRSSLDHLAWQLAHLGGLGTKETYFPVTTKNSLETQIKITKATFGMPDEAITMVKSLQPYHAGEAYTSNHLWRLNTLWNLDKHRNIALNCSITDEMLWLPSDVTIKTESLDDCAIVRFPLAAKDKMRFNPTPGVDVRFGSPPDGITLSIDDFRDIFTFVSVEVLPRFSRFFS